MSSTKFLFSLFTALPSQHDIINTITSEYDIIMLWTHISIAHDNSAMICTDNASHGLSNSYRVVLSLVKLPSNHAWVRVVGTS